MYVYVVGVSLRFRVSIVGECLIFLKRQISSREWHRPNLVESLDKEDKRKNRKRYKVVNKEAVMAAIRTAFEYLNKELVGKGGYRKLYKLVTWII